MSQFILRTIWMAGVVTGLSVISAHAQVRISDGKLSPSLRQATYRPVIRGQSPQPVYFAGPKKIIINPQQGGGPPVPMTTPAPKVTRIPAQNGYVRLDAPLYPVPRPNIPWQVGSTFSTNQVLAPHEMLYPHSYRALYPPFYYHVHGDWHALLGHMTTNEYWELKGTEVQVDYCSRVPLLSLFRNPFLLLD